MGLTDYISDKERFGDKKYEAFLKLKKKLQNDGLSERIAVYKASVVLTPDDLEKINLNAKQNAGLRPHLKFFFDNPEEIKLVNKYFDVSYRQMAVKDSKLLLKLLKMLGEVK